MASMAFELDQVFVLSQDPNAALDAANRKQEDARAAGDERGRALGLIKAGDATVQLGRIDEAQYYAQEAMGICGEMKYEEGRAAAMNVMAKVLMKKGRDEEELEEALDSATDSLKSFRKLNVRRGEAAATGTVSAIYAAMGRSAPAVKNAREAVTMFAELGDALAMAEMYVIAKDGYMAKNDTVRAEKSMQKAVSIYQDAGNKGKEASANHSLASVAVAGADFKKASDYLTKARALFGAAGDYKGQAAVLSTLQDLYMKANMYMEAVTVGQKRCELFQDAADVSGQAEAMVRLAELMLDNDDHQNAEKVASDALNICMPIGDYERMGMAKTVVDDAQKAKKIEEIGMALHLAGDYCNIPTSLIVDPGMSRRMHDSYQGAMRG